MASPAPGRSRPSAAADGRPSRAGPLRSNHSWPLRPRCTRWPGCEPAWRCFGRIHALRQAFPAGPAAAAPRFANYVAAPGLVQAVAAGTRRIRAWRPTPAEARLADLADRLADTLARWDLACPVPIRRQLVHGDYWDDNVRFRGRQVALVTDFDFLGERPRTDDLALTLYYTSVDIADTTRDPAQLAELVGAYESGLGTRLSQDERAAIPRAMARQPLWSIAVWVALLDNQETARRHLVATGAELKWALQLTGRIAQVQDALTNRLSVKGSPPAGSHINTSAQQDRTTDELPGEFPLIWPTHAVERAQKVLSRPPAGSLGHSRNWPAIDLCVSRSTKSPTLLGVRADVLYGGAATSTIMNS